MNSQAVSANPVIFGATRVRAFAVVIAATIIPTALLFRPNVGFYIDWANTIFLAGYQTESLRTFGHFSRVINTSEVLGMPFPIFYGHLFFRIAGIFGLIFGVDIGFRLLIIAAFAAQASSVFYAARQVGMEVMPAIAVVFAVNLAAYPLTDLYNRSDLPELVAILMIFTASALWFARLGAIKHGRTPSSALTACACLALTILSGTHVISAVLGGAALLAIVLLTFTFTKSEGRLSNIRFLCLTTTAYLAGALPVVIAVISVPHLTVDHQNLYWFGDSIDSIVGRLLPTPTDVRSLIHGAQGVSTPYLEAPVETSLIILAGFAVAKTRNRRAAALIVIASSICLFTLLPGPWYGISKLISFIQFPYRLTSYINLFLLAAILTTYASRSKQATRWTPHFGVAVCSVALTISCINVIAKLTHGSTAMHSFSARAAFTGAAGKPAYTQLPESFYGTNDYTTRSGDEFTASPKLVTDRPITFTQFGHPGDMALKSDADGLILTRVQNFAWNFLTIDGKAPVDQRRLSLDLPGAGRILGLITKPLTLQHVAFETRPPVLWDVAVRLEDFVLVVELAAVTIPFFHRVRRHFQYKV